MQNNVSDDETNGFSRNVQNLEGNCDYVKASYATDSQGKHKHIHESPVNTYDEDVKLSVSNNFFYAKSLH